MMNKTGKIIITSVLAITLSGAALAFGSHHYISSLSPQEKAQKVASRFGDKLDLQPMQQQKLDDLGQGMASLFQQMAQQKNQRQQIIDDLLNDQATDQAALLARVQAKTEWVNQQAPQMIALLADFVDTLDNEQKAELKEMVNHRRAHGFGHHHDDGDDD